MILYVLQIESFVLLRSIDQRENITKCAQHQSRSTRKKTDKEKKPAKTNQFTDIYDHNY